MDRPIREIAADIEGSWNKVNYAARPYLDAMHELWAPDDHFGLDSGRSVIAYFLANASSWRGDTARAIKKELNQMIGR
jgi:hypothetical protein